MIIPREYLQKENKVYRRTGYTIIQRFDKYLEEKGIPLEEAYYYICPFCKKEKLGSINTFRGIRGDIEDIYNQKGITLPVHEGTLTPDQQKQILAGNTPHSLKKLSRTYTPPKPIVEKPEPTVVVKETEKPKENTEYQKFLEKYKRRE